jgi:CheY-like chemotaxis protein
VGIARRGERASVEEQFNRVINALPALVGTALPDGKTYVLNQRSIPQRPEGKTGDSGFGAIQVPVSRDPSELHEESVKDKRLLISLVDDDESIRESVPDLLRECGYAAQAFSSGEEFLASDYLAKTSCLILDVVMPGMTGPDLQRELAIRPEKIPIIFITAQRDQMLHRRLLNLGAVKCLLKPFSEADLLEALNAALQGN